MKQNKVLNKLNQLRDGTANLGAKNDDEWYTPNGAIQAELDIWANLGKFKGKRIICPCDWDIVSGEDIYSITIDFKDDDVEVTGNSVVKHIDKVYYDLWSEEEAKFVEMNVKEEDLEELLYDKLTCNFVRYFAFNARRLGIKSVTASGYNPDLDRGVRFQEVDYSKYDVCVTNPPFSCYREFLNCIIGKVDFIVLAPFMNRVSPSVGLPLQLRQAYLGFGRSIGINKRDKSGEQKNKSVACDWLSSWDDAQKEVDNKHYRTGIKYETYKDDYAIMDRMTMLDGTHPIDVKSKTTYPDDYDGWMFGPISVLTDLDQSKYEWYCSGQKGHYNSVKNIFKHQATNDMLGKRVDGKSRFHGILFRKRTDYKE